MRLGLSRESLRLTEIAQLSLKGTDYPKEEGSQRNGRLLVKQTAVTRMCRRGVPPMAPERRLPLRVRIPASGESGLSRCVVHLQIPRQVSRC